MILNHTQHWPCHCCKPDTFSPASDYTVYAARRGKW